MCGRLFFLAPIVCRPHTLAHLTTVREETKHNKSSGVKEINPKSGVTGRQQLLLSLSCYGFLQIVGGPPSNGNRKRSSRFFTPRREKSHTHKHTQLDTNGENILVVVFFFIQKKNSYTLIRLQKIYIDGRFKGCLFYLNDKGNFGNEIFQISNISIRNSRFMEFTWCTRNNDWNWYQR
jgi:hypothetical protein